jgi:two-component system, OmpR family, sensor histidine kinase BaeS
MRSLTLKLTLAFLLVGLTGVALVALGIRERTRSAFDTFLLNRDQQTLVDNLLEYYQTAGSWQGVADAWQADPGGPPPPFNNDRRNFRRDWQRYTLVGPDGIVVFSPFPEQVGRQVNSAQLGQAIPLSLNNQVVGWLLPPTLPHTLDPNSPEGAFLQNVNHAIGLSALAAVILALALGGFLAFTLTRSLRELTEATIDLAHGKLGRQVKVRSKDELGKLAISFNQMSQDLERATMARRQMTADIAHDLRSPLSVIAGYAEALSDGKLPGTPETYGVLHQETKHLSRLVDDLRLLSLVDAGELPLQLQPSSPRALLEWVVARHAVASQQAGISFRIKSGANLPEVIVDEERMAQVFDNLILNAFRYTPAGGEILLSAEQVGGALQFTVSDNGSGIAAEDLPNIFERFYRGDKARQQNGESGLGLAIAKSIVEAHGGSIAVESVPGQGTQFTICLPVAPTHAATV